MFPVHTVHLFGVVGDFVGHRVRVNRRGGNIGSNGRSGSARLFLVRDTIRHIGSNLVGLSRGGLVRLHRNRFLRRPRSRVLLVHARNLFGVVGDFVGHFVRACGSRICGSKRTCRRLLSVRNSVRELGVDVLPRTRSVERLERVGRGRRELVVNLAQHRHYNISFIGLRLTNRRGSGLGCHSLRRFSLRQLNRLCLCRGRGYRLRSLSLRRFSLGLLNGLCLCRGRGRRLGSLNLGRFNLGLLNGLYLCRGRGCKLRLLRSLQSVLIALFYINLANLLGNIGGRGIPEQALMLALEPEAAVSAANYRGKRTNFRFKRRGFRGNIVRQHDKNAVFLRVFTYF